MVKISIRIFNMEELHELKNYASENSVPIMFDDGVEFIVNYIKENYVSFILEIGTAIGYSAIKFAQIHPEIRVFTIEYDIERYHQAVKNVNKYNLGDQITVFLGDALKFNFTEKFDLIFIDGAKSQYINFFEKYKNNLSKNGVFISDNLFFHGMVENPELTKNYSTIKLLRKLKHYIDFLKSNSEFETTFYEIGDGVAVSRRK